MMLTIAVLIICFAVLATLLAMGRQIHRAHTASIPDSTSPALAILEGEQQAFAVAQSRLSRELELLRGGKK